MDTLPIMRRKTAARRDVDGDRDPRLSPSVTAEKDYMGRYGDANTLVSLGIDVIKARWPRNTINTASTTSSLTMRKNMRFFILSTAMIVLSLAGAKAMDAPRQGHEIEQTPYHETARTRLNSPPPTASEQRCYWVQWMTGACSR